MKILDRYIIRESIAPILMALAIFTFLLAVRPMMDEAEKLLARQVPPQTIGILLAHLIPQALGITIPMALLAGLLMAFGRLSADREAVAMLACGVSYTRLLRPVAIVSAVAAAATLWVMVEAIPNGNRRYLEIIFQLLTQQIEQDVRPRVFFERFPNKVIYVQETPSSGGWRRLLIGDTTQPARPALLMADAGRLVIDREKRTVHLVLVDGARYIPGAPGTDKDGTYDVGRFASNTFELDPNSAFPPAAGIGDHPNSQTIEQLRKEIPKKLERGESPHPQIIAIQQKFSFPAACFVLGLIALVVGLHTRREGKFAAFTIGIAVIFVYYALMFLSENLVKSGNYPALNVWARWVPNIALGAVGLLLLWRRTHGGGRRWLPPLPAAVANLVRRKPSGDAAATGAAGPRAGGRRVVLVVKIPDLHMLRPRLLDLYIGTRYVKVLALTFFGLLALFYISTVIDLSDNVFKGQATSGGLLAYMIYSTPEYIYYILPLSVLLGVLVTIGILTKSSELTIMRACGVSLYRASAPLLLLALLTSGLIFVVQEKMLARGKANAQAVRDAMRNIRPSGSALTMRRWVSGRNGVLYHFSHYDPRTKQLQRLNIFELDQTTWRLKRQIYTPAARFRGGVWQAEAGWIQTFPASGPPARAVLPAGRMEQIEHPDYFGTENEKPDEMSLAELGKYIEDLEASGADASRARVEYHRKIAFPFVAIVMTLIAIPFAVTTGRRGALYGVGLGIALSIAYWFVATVFGALGSVELLPAVLAAWAPNVFFAGGAAYLLLTVRT